MNRLIVLDVPIADLKTVERQQLGDSRGFVARLFCAKELATAGWHKPIAQINQSLTHKRGTIRGLHFQHMPHTEMKLVTCLRGAVWDVAVDVRAGSPTFLQWHAVELSDANHRATLIPEGFAHGFQTLCDECELIYMHSMPYSPESDTGLNSKDPMLSIHWPLAVTEISARDSQHAMLDEQFKGVLL